MTTPWIRGAVAGWMAGLGALLIYGEHLFSLALDRSWAHYIADAVQALGFWLVVAVLVRALVQRGRARAVMLATCTWCACECGLTIAGGIMGFGGIAEPEQWQGLFGRQLGLPMAACGLTAFAVFILSLWGADET